ncbi:MAG TPA: (d)CMP kinase [Actinomycetota bacterium]
MRKRPLIAIDGPAGSGKSTLARRLAETLDLPYLNTGLMYRALALEALRAGVDADDGAALADLARTITFDLDQSVRPPALRIDGAEPEADLTSPEVESNVSRVSRHPEVRRVLRDEQRRLSERGGVVEGRDIGTVVTPRADVKLFLEAEESARVSRRAGERAARNHHVAAELSARDALDARTNPMEPAEDAMAIDTTAMDADRVFAVALAVTRARLEERGW